MYQVKDSPWWAVVSGAGGLREDTCHSWDPCRLQPDYFSLGDLGLPHILE